MAVAGAGKSCYRYQVRDGELVCLSQRQEVSIKVSNKIDDLMATLERGEVAYVSSVYPVPQQLREAWAAKQASEEAS